MSNVDPNRDRTRSDPAICVLCSVSHARIVTVREHFVVRFYLPKNELEMERAISTDDSCAKRLSTITEYSEPGIDSDDNDREERREEESAIPRGDSEQRLEEQATAVKYFLVDDSPMAKFSRSIKWIYKKVSLESTSVKEICTFPSSRIIIVTFAQWLYDNNFIAVILRSKILVRRRKRKGIDERETEYRRFRCESRE